MKGQRFLCLVFCLIFTAISLYPCSMITAARNGKVLVGNNEDWLSPDEHLFFVPASSGTFGYVLYGENTVWPQSGMNDQGFIFDFFSTPYLEIKNPESKPQLDGHPGVLFLERCTTVAEALDILDKFALGGMEESQMMIVDKTGDAAIIEGDVIHRKSRPWMISTNFLQSQVEEDEEPPCERYRIAVKMLSEMDISVETFRKILKAIHFEGAWGGTQHSSIFIPEDGIIHLYNFHNYEDSVVIDLHKELAKGARSVKISDLFPEYFPYKIYREAMPDSDADLIVKAFREQGAEAALDLADKIAEGLEKIMPLLDEYFKFDPVTLVNREREWSFAMVAGKHWKIRSFTGGAPAVNLAAAKLAEQKKISEAIQLLEEANDRYPNSPFLLYTTTSLHIESGDKDSALNVYHRLTEIYPEDNYWVKDLFFKIEKMKK